MKPRSSHAQGLGTSRRDQEPALDSSRHLHAAAPSLPGTDSVAAQAPHLSDSWYLEENIAAQILWVVAIMVRGASMGNEMMGKVLATVRVENLEDLYRVGQGAIQSAEMRRVEVTDALVDTGADNAFDAGSTDPAAWTHAASRPAGAHRRRDCASPGVRHSAPSPSRDATARVT